MSQSSQVNLNELNYRVSNSSSVIGRMLYGKLEEQEAILKQIQIPQILNLPTNLKKASIHSSRTSQIPINTEPNNQKMLLHFRNPVMKGKTRLVPYLKRRNSPPMLHHLQQQFTDKTSLAGFIKLKTIKPASLERIREIRT